MPERLRFTGRNPPPDLWQIYPNWRNAYEEEGVPGQDETTLMPHETQTYIGPHTSFTAGLAHFHDGRRFPAFLAIGASGMDGCEVYQFSVPWRIYYDYPQRRWVPFRAEWLPHDQRPPAVALDNDSVFPLEIRMTVPWRQGGVPSAYRITPDGRLHEITWPCQAETPFTP